MGGLRRSSWSAPAMVRGAACQRTDDPDGQPARCPANVLRPVLTRRCYGTSPRSRAGGHRRIPATAPSAITVPRAAGLAGEPPPPAAAGPWPAPSLHLRGRLGAARQQPVLQVEDPLGDLEPAGVQLAAELRAILT